MHGVEAEVVRAGEDVVLADDLRGGAQRLLPEHRLPVDLQGAEEGEQDVEEAPEASPGELAGPPALGRLQVLVVAEGRVGHHGGGQDPEARQQHHEALPHAGDLPCAAGGPVLAQVEEAVLEVPDVEEADGLLAVAERRPWVLVLQADDGPEARLALHGGGVCDDKRAGDESAVELAQVQRRRGRARLGGIAVPKPRLPPRLHGHAGGVEEDGQSPGLVAVVVVVALLLEQERVEAAEGLLDPCVPGLQVACKALLSQRLLVKALRHADVVPGALPALRGRLHAWPGGPGSP